MLRYLLTYGGLAWKDVLVPSYGLLIKMSMNDWKPVHIIVCMWTMNNYTYQADLEFRELARLSASSMHSCKKLGFLSRENVVFVPL